MVRGRHVHYEMTNTIFADQSFTGDKIGKKFSPGGKKFGWMVVMVKIQLEIFVWRKSFIFFALWAKFILPIFNDYIEPMVIFTAWAKYFRNARVAG